MNREGQEYLAKKAKEFHKKMSKKKLDLAAIPAVAFDAQRLEKERLERLVRNKKEFNDSIYTPLVINRPSTKEEENLTANGDDHLRSN